MRMKAIVDQSRGRAAVLMLTAVLVALLLLGGVYLALAQTPPIEVEKLAAPDTLASNNIVKYTVLFTNTSGADVDLVRITDTLPSGFMWVYMGGDSDIADAPSGTTGAIVWAEGTDLPYTVGAGATRRLTYNVYTSAPAAQDPYENQVVALLSTGEKVQGAVSVQVIGVALSGSKVASQSQVRMNETVAYTVTLRNDGVTDADLSAITDTLPVSFAFGQMVSGLEAPAVDGDSLVWEGPIVVTAGQEIQFSYWVTVGGTAGQSYENSVQVAYASEVEGPYTVSVEVLAAEYLAYLPTVIKDPEPTPTPTPSPTPTPTPSADRLAYDSNTGDNFEIYAVNADGSQLVNVSNIAGGDLDPAWSPDGSRVAWVHFVDGKGDIMVANADGTNRVNLTNHAKEDRGPVWSPDGSKILFHSYRLDRWELYLLDPDTGGLTQFTFSEPLHLCQSHDGVWSPDGTKVAYVCGLDQWAEIYVRNADGTNWRRLTNNEVPDEKLEWAPDSIRLAYVQYDGRSRKDSEIWVVNVDTENHQQLTNNDYADYTPVWSPDGTKIAFSTYVDGSYEIATMNTIGGSLINLTQTAKGDYVPRWSPDGSKISFITNRNGNYELYVMDANGSNQTRLTTTSADESIHEWRP